MKTLQAVIAILVILLAGCEAEQETVSAVDASTPAAERDSFRMRNAEIREDIIAGMVANGIEYWINDDGSIGFFSADGEALDKIYYDAVGRYAARN